MQKTLSIITAGHSGCILSMRKQVCEASLASGGKTNFGLHLASIANTYHLRTEKWF
jgi:hypothetical protein